MRELCAAAKREDWQYVQAHAQLPLRGQEQVGTEQQPLRVGGVLGEDKPQQVQHRAVCKYLKETTKALRDFELEADEAHGVVTLNGQDYRLTIALSPPQLVEQKLLVRKPTPTSLAPVFAPLPIVVSVEGRGQEADIERFLAALVKEELDQRPNCARMQAARDPVSLSLAIEVRTRPKRVPRVDLYASTVADARFLACLQSQLVPVLERALARPRETKVYKLWTMIGIVVKDDSAHVDSVILGPGE